MRETDLRDVGVEVHLLPGGGGPVVPPAQVLHPVDQTHEVLGVGLKEIPERAGVLSVNHHQLSHMAEHHHVQHARLPSKEVFLLPQHLTAK